ncbi:acyl carrier protein [Planctomycetes bacterium K23_9]|uniref:Acyl carrier protein n=1 Tax=Stieleria marina TaxID=1930275 RepID=A0A517NTY5_9BACT|nr:Acyl carrier protein [Planctomycetes bacterium K23_9]
MTSQSHQVTPNRCPLCESSVSVETTDFFGEIDCPDCNKRLWFLAAADSARFFEQATSGDLQQQAIQMIAEKFELDPQKLAGNPQLINDVDTDSLEALELIMDLEDELGLV